VARTKDDPVAVDEYLAQLSPDRRAVLEELRQLIKSSVPGVRERISYGTSVIFALEGDLVRLCLAAEPPLVLNDEPRPCESHEGRDHEDAQALRCDHSLHARESAADLARREGARSTRNGTAREGSDVAADAHASSRVGRLSRMSTVRRLVAEGTRPRLPWAPRCAPSRTIRSRCSSCSTCSRTTWNSWFAGRSPNNLNDIGKDNPTA